jgi:predicted metalloprotease with PDZ domain
MSTSFSRRLGVLLLALFLAPAAASAQAAIEYTVSIPHPEQRWLQVDVRFPVHAGKPFEVRMARSSPGRYATHEFGKNVYRFEALGDGGRALPIELVAPAHWRVTPTATTLHVRYRLFADHVDGTYAAVDGTHAHLNAPATFAWAPSLPETPIRVRLEQPAGRRWKVATQLFPTSEALTFTAPNFQYFMDSPIEFSDHATREFSVIRPDGGPAATVRLAVHHLGTDAQLDAFAEQIEAIVREQAAVFGGLPAFDGGTYTFLMDYLPWANGDGMEHRNSTVCSSSGALADGPARLADTASHEFFHAWNVERIRPAALEPFDFTKANMSGELWLSEGFTDYYGALTMIRAGIVPAGRGVEDFVHSVNGALLSPGTQFRSAVDMSRLAPYVDAATAVDATSWESTYYSYYPYGAAIALGLDLTLRERSGGKVSLDDYMRELWKTHGLPGGKAPGYVARPYTLKDAEAALARVSGDGTFASQFFARHILGTEPIPYATLLAAVGYDLKPRSSGGYVGDVDLRPDGGRLVVARNTVSGTPANDAGLGRKDVVISLAGTALAKPEDWARTAAGLAPGSEVDLVFESRGQRRTARVTVVKDPRLSIVAVAQPTPEQLALRDGWLKSRR